MARIKRSISTADRFGSLPDAPAQETDDASGTYLPHDSSTGADDGAQFEAELTRARRRFVIALLVAFAVHVALFALVPQRTLPPASERTVTQRIALETRTPAPTPAPTPPRIVPTPRITPPPHYTLEPRVVVRAPAPKAVSPPHHRVGGAAAPRRLVVVRPPERQPAHPQSIADGTQAGVANGGAGLGAGPGVGDGGLGGTGSGTGGKGNGSGGDTNGAPCGDIFLLPADIQYRHDGTAVQGVLAKVVLLDGTVQVGAFPYPFTYPSKLEDPFITLPPGGTIPVQEPPAGSDLDSMPPAVQVVLKHTNPATGKTSMPECTHDDPAA